MWSPTKKSINTSCHIFSLTMFDHVWQSTNYHHQQQQHHHQQQHQHEHQHHQQSCLTYWQSTNINKRSSSRFPEPSRGFLTDLLEAFVLGEAREHLVGTFHEESIAIWRLYGGSMEVPTIYKAYFSGLCKGISQQNMAKNMVLTYLHFRILKFPLILFAGGGWVWDRISDD